MSEPDAAVGRWADLQAAAAFLTPLVRTRGSPAPGTMTMFPVVGAALGLAVGGCWHLARRSLAALPAAVSAVAADIALTGALHLDGVADTADGLFAHATAKDRLAIMAEPEVGAFGTVALTTALLARAAALSSIDPSPVLLGAIWSCSRSLMAIASSSLPYAREGGLATAFLSTGEENDRALRAGIAGLIASAMVACALRGRRGLVGLVAGMIAGSVVLYAARRRLGGFTGDVLGAAGVTCETVALLAIAKRRHIWMGIAWRA